MSVICGRRSLDETRSLLDDFKKRTDGRLPDLFTSDELANYKTVLLETYGIETPRVRQGDRGRFPNPILTPPPDLVYALLHKHRRNGEVIRVDVRQVYGTQEALERALEASPVSFHVNTAFVERYNGTDRHRNSRKVRKTYAFSKDWEMHEHATWLSVVGYNFCHAPRTRAKREANGRRRPRSPAMLQGITNRVWAIGDVMRWQVVRP